MKTITAEMVKNILPGATMQFLLDNSACVMRSRQAVHYVKMNLLMPDGVVDYKTSFDKKTNIMSITAIKG